MTHYVLCITRNSAGNFIMLEKKRPDWQAERFNFPGGKVEQGETIQEAASREYFEEVGVGTFTIDWEHIANLEGEGYHVSVMKFCGQIDKARTQTDERVAYRSLPEILACPHAFIESCAWLAALSLDKEQKFVTVEYSQDRPESDWQTIQELKRQLVNCQERQGLYQEINGQIA